MLLAVAEHTYRRIDRTHDRRWHTLADNDVGAEGIINSQDTPSCHRGQMGRSNVDWRQPSAPGCKQPRGSSSQTRQMELVEAGIGQFCAKGEQKARTPQFQDVGAAHLAPPPPSPLPLTQHGKRDLRTDQLTDTPLSRA